MNISINSMIYKFLDHSPFDVPINLCPYMRHFILVVLFELVLGLIVALAILATLWAPIAFFFSLDFGIEGCLRILTFLGVLLWVIGVLIFTIWAWTRVFRKHGYVRRTWYQIREKIEGNIFMKWFQAIHDKICPEIRFTDS